MANTSLNGAEATVAFSPNGDAIKLMVKAIKGAIPVQTYGFTRQEIIRTLGMAQGRGIDVEAILDKINRSDHYSGATYLKNHHIPVWIDDSVAIAHNKVMIIDDGSVITGSFNFTRSTQQTKAENILFICHAPPSPGYTRITGHGGKLRSGVRLNKAVSVSATS